MVSHDRDLLNDAVDAHPASRSRQAHHSTRAITTTSSASAREQQALTVKLKKKQEEQRQHMEAFVERFRYKASKARQAQSRLKALAKLAAHRRRGRGPRRAFPFSQSGEAAGAAGRHAGTTPRSAMRDDKPVLRNITLRLDPDDRIALLGSNGNGKSTFAKLLCGKLKRRSAARCSIRRSSRSAISPSTSSMNLSAERTPYEYFAA